MSRFCNMLYSSFVSFAVLQHNRTAHDCSHLCGILGSMKSVKTSAVDSSLRSLRRLQLQTLQLAAPQHFAVIAKQCSVLILFHFVEISLRLVWVDWLVELWPKRFFIFVRFFRLLKILLCLRRVPGWRLKQIVEIALVYPISGIFYPFFLIPPTVVVGKIAMTLDWKSYKHCGQSVRQVIVVSAHTRLFHHMPFRGRTWAAERYFFHIIYSNHGKRVVIAGTRFVPGMQQSDIVPRGHGSIQAIYMDLRIC